MAQDIEQLTGGLYKKNSDGIYTNVFDGTPYNGPGYNNDGVKKSTIVESKNNKNKTNNINNSFPKKKRNTQQISLRYPSEFIHEQQDCLQFRIFKYERGSKKVASFKDTVVEKRNTKGKVTSKSTRKDFSGSFGTNSRLTGGPAKLLKNALGLILLPVPSGVADSNSAGYGESSLNTFQAGAMGAVDKTITSKDVGTAVSALGAGLASLGDISGDPRTRDLFNAWIGAKAVGVFGGNITTDQVTMRNNGFVINPNMELLFTGPAIRKFEFQFKLTPRDQAETESVKQIIRTFKQSMAPTRGSSWQLNAPHIFELSYRKGSDPHPFLNKFKTCALSGMNVNYTADGNYATYHDGTPISMLMNLSFQELTPIYNEDYDSDWGSGGVGY